ncbi:MAG: hypothetical protein AB7E95_10820, partial [Kiritimatiellales bacterium]
MNKRQELAKEVQTRLAAGERKDAIYDALKGRYSAASVERSLAQWPYPEAKAANTHINRMMLMIWSILTILNIALALNAASQLPMPAKLLVFIAPLIQVAILVGLKNCNLLAYLLVIVMGLRTLLIVRTLNSQSFLLLAITVLAMAMAGYLKTRLFP